MKKFFKKKSVVMSLCVVVLAAFGMTDPQVAAVGAELVCNVTECE